LEEREDRATVFLGRRRDAVAAMNARLFAAPSGSVNRNQRHFNFAALASFPSCADMGRA
jgi:hypothetical protein